MDISKIAIGHNPPFDVNAIIEIPQGGLPIKYELDKASGALMVDRFLHTSMVYPANYGFIPHTLSRDGDPLDIMVITQVPVMATAIIRCRPVGMMVMEDEAGGDDKIIAVPLDKLNPYYSKVENYTDLPMMLRDQIAHFFQHYKDLEPGKWVRIMRWTDTKHAAEEILRSIAREEKKKASRS